MEFILNPVVVSIGSGICVAIIIFFNFENIKNYLVGRALTNHEEIMRYLDLMFVETSSKKVQNFTLLISYGVGSLFILIFWPNILLGIIVGFLYSFFAIKIPLIYVKAEFHKRCKYLVNQMVDGMTIMANGIKAGLSITQCMDRVVDNMAGPISQEFRLVLNKTRLGMTVEDALNEMAERIPMQDVQMLVTAVNILKETGGNLSETFETINTTVRERQKVEKKIEALTAQGSMQGIIISLVPFGLLLMFWAIDPNFIKPLFSTTVGIGALFVIMVLIVMGGLMIKKIVTIKV